VFNVGLRAQSRAKKNTNSKWKLKLCGSVLSQNCGGHPQLVRNGITGPRLMSKPTVCEFRWAEIIILASFEKSSDDVIEAHPNAVEETGLVHTSLVIIRKLIQTLPKINGNGETWKQLTAKAEAERKVLSNYLEGKALLRLYSFIHRELQKTVQPENAEIHNEFREQRRPKRNPSDVQVLAKKSNNGITRNPPELPQVPMLNLFAALRTQVDLEENKENTSAGMDGEQLQTTSSQTGRPPPIMLTSATNLLLLQKILGEL
jgi:hypothetical protein